MFNTTTIPGSNHQLIAKIFFISGLPMIIINIFGNLMSTVVFLQKRFRSTSTGFYFCCLSISDILQTYLIFGFYIQQYNIQIDNLSDNLCKIHHYLYATLPLFSAWMLVIISIDRCISSKCIQLARVLNKRFTQILVVLITGIILSLLNTADFLLYEIKSVDGTSTDVCTISQDLFDMSQRFLMYNCLISITLAPFFVMTCANLLTIRNLFRSKKQFLNKKDNDLSKEVRFGATIISMNILFLVFYIPVCVVMMLSSKPYSISITENEEFYDGKLYFAFYVMVYLRHSHSCLQFFIYLYANRIFRKEFVVIVTRFFRISTLGLSELSKSSSNQDRFSLSTKKSNLSLRN
jgi:hypothetical protein